MGSSSFPPKACSSRATRPSSSSSDAAPPFDGVAGADDDDDGLVALLEHAFGGNDDDPTAAAYPKTSVEQLEVGGVSGDYLIIRIQRDLAAEDMTISGETSSDLTRWESGPAAVVLLHETANGDGTSTLTFRSTEAVESGSKTYIRARAEQRQ